MIALQTLEVETAYGPITLKLGMTVRATIVTGHQRLIAPVKNAIGKT
jgi:hypothetical protein